MAAPCMRARLHDQDEHSSVSGRESPEKPFAGSSSLAAMDLFPLLLRVSSWGVLGDSPGGTAVLLFNHLNVPLRKLGQLP